MFKRPQYIVLGLVALLTLILLNLPQHTANQFKLAIGSLFLPLFGLSKSAQQVRDHVGQAIVPRSALLKENEQLRLDNQQLKIQVMQGDAALRENDQLRQLLGWEKQSPWKPLRSARVIARDPANWWRNMQIDVGSRDGIRPDMPVLTSAGLVGRISTVNLASSQVALIGSLECKVGALVTNRTVRTVETGVIVPGNNPLDNTWVTLSFLSSNSSLKPGQQVVTWGEGKIFPFGIVIGQIAEESRQTEFGYAEAKVKLAVDSGELEEVWVLMK